MTTSAHYGLVDAVAALLLAAPALAGGRVVANRRRPMGQAVESQVFVYLEDSTATRHQTSGGATRWDTRIRIECVARDTAAGDAGRNADALQTRVAARLLASVALGGLAVDIALQALAWTEQEADTTVSACQAMYSVWHEISDRVITA